MSINILVVDDSTLVRSVVKQTLEMTGVDIKQIHEAENGRLALESLQSNEVDIIFTDLNMPEMTGIEMIEAIKQNDKLKSIPIVVISSIGNQPALDKLKAMGIKDYLRKPVTPESLSEVIDSNLSAGGSHG